MRRRSEIISMGLSIAIAAVLLIQLLPLQSPPIRDLPKASKPVPMVPPKSVALAAVPLPGPPSAPVLVATATTPAAARLEQRNRLAELRGMLNIVADAVGEVETVRNTAREAEQDAREHVRE